MSRFKMANAKLPLLRPYLFYKCFKENLRNKTALRQRYYLIRKYIMQYFAAAKVKANVIGLNKIDNLDNLFFVVKASNNYEKLIAYEAISKPLKLMLDKNDFNNFIYNRILKYLKAERINYEDIYDEAAAYRDIRNDLINNRVNYLTFINDSKYLLDPAIKAKATIVPIKLENNEALLDENNNEEIIVDVKILGLIDFNEYKEMKKEELKEEILKKLEGEKNE